MHDVALPPAPIVPPRWLETSSVPAIVIAPDAAKTSGRVPVPGTAAPLSIGIGVPVSAQTLSSAGLSVAHRPTLSVSIVVSDWNRRSPLGAVAGHTSARLLVPKHPGAASIVTPSAGLPSPVIGASMR